MKYYTCNIIEFHRALGRREVEVTQLLRENLPAREELANKTLHQVQLRRYGIVVQVHIGLGPGSVPGAGTQIDGTCHRRWRRNTDKYVRLAQSVQRGAQWRQGPRNRRCPRRTLFPI